MNKPRRIRSSATAVLFLYLFMLKAVLCISEAIVLNAGSHTHTHTLVWFVTCTWRCVSCLMEWFSLVRDHLIERKNDCQ